MTTPPSAPLAAPRRREWLLAALAALAGCGGGVDSGGTGTGSGDQTLAVGTITGFGSIIVNGVRFDDSAASVEDDDGKALRADDLRLGMRVELTAGTIATVGGVPSAAASAIRVRSALVGPVESVDVGAGRLVVLGQRVDLSATSVLQGALADLQTGDIVRAYGTLDVAGSRTVATRLEALSGVTAYRVRGVVSSVDLAARTLDIGPLRVDWSAAAPSDPARMLVAGRIVSLRLATTAASGVWPALSLSIEGSMPRPDREEAEVEGRITAWDSVTSFTVDGVPVDASAATFPDGRTGVVLGAKVEVEGRLVSGVLLARQVELEDDEGDDESFELHGTIQSVDAAARQFVVRGTTVRWSDSTQFESSTAADIVVGREVEVRGRLAPGESVIAATRVHVER